MMTGQSVRVLGIMVWVNWHAFLDQLFGTRITEQHGFETTMKSLGSVIV